MKTILVVDDELGSTEALTLILADEGYRAFSASNGRDGLTRAEELQPDLIVLDYMMPLLNGAEVARALRAQSRTSGIPILMNSSLSENAVREHTRDYDAFLRKPYSVDNVLRTIARLLHD